MKVVKMACLVLLNSVFYLQSMQERELEMEVCKHFSVQAQLDHGWIDYLNALLVQLSSPAPYSTTDTNILFAHYPQLQEKLPYVALGQLPTPVAKLEAITSTTGVAVYCKRDDFAAPLYGGNKIRKLEYLLAQARASGATKVMTFGCAGSNHAVATTIQAHRLGLQSVCMLKYQLPSPVVQRNLLLHAAYGSELHYNATNGIRALNTLMVWLEHYKKDGRPPYIIPTGGSNLFGTIGFVQAAFELAEQIKAGIIPQPTHIYVPCGSCATTAGLLLGCKVAGIQAQIVAVAVEPDEEPSFADTVRNLFKETNTYLHNLDASFPLVTYTDNDLWINLDFTGSDYGVATQEGAQAMALMQNLEGIPLDGTYTAKAFAGLLHNTSTIHKNNSDTVILFWNTYCGLDVSEQIKDADYRTLPLCLQGYFDK